MLRSGLGRAVAAVGCCLVVTLSLLPAVTAAQQDREVHIKKCVTRSPGLEPPPRERPKSIRRQVGPLVLDDAEGEPRSTLVAAFRFPRLGEVAPEHDKNGRPKVLVAFAPSRTPGSAGCAFRFELLGDKDRLLAIYGIPDPRHIFVDQYDPEEEDTTEPRLVDSAVHVARFPFSPDARKINVLDSKGTQLTSLDVTPAIDEFCKSHPKRC